MMAGMEFNSTRKVSSLNLSAVSRAGLGKYVGTVELATEVMGNATISKWKTKRFTVLISADASRRTTACGMVSSGSSSKANEAPQGTAWARDLADTNPGVLPMGSFMDSYAVPRGKTLIVHNVEPIANNGFVDCQLGDGLDVYSVSHAREDRGTSRFIAMTNPVVFSENTRVAYGAKAGNGGRGATSFSCSFLGVLVDNDRFDSPGNFKGFNAIHIRSGIRPATMRYTVPQGKKFTLLNNIGSSLDNDDVRCSMHFGGSNTFHFKFATMPGSTTRAIPRPITFEAGTAITFEVDIRGAGLVDIGHCSWVGYESDED